MSSRAKRVLAVASAGGHWVQLMRLRPALERHHVTYVTTMDGLAEQSNIGRSFVVKDASRNEPFRLLLVVWAVGRLVLSIKPEVIISTGAAPGLIALFIGKLMGARTIWLDSMANAEELSMSGRLAKHCADLWLTQWPDLSGESGPYYKGTVI